VAVVAVHTRLALRDNLGNFLARSLGRTLKLTGAEITRGQSTSLVENVDKHCCTVCGKAAALLGKVVLKDGIRQLPYALVK